MEIRSETPADIAAIEAVTVAAFQHAAHTQHTEQFIVAALRRSGALTVSLVAEEEGEVIGHVAVSPVTVSGGVAGWYGLGPVSVAPACQGRGVGRALVKRALAELRAQGVAGCVVLGEPDYYARFGFVAEPALVLAGVPAEYFQALAFIGPPPSGTGAYHSAFAATV
ncbi:GNAT family N-acetyltransferase [Stenotrophomonas sp. JC08]|uniref:GNAT family N-acetyltransferase n=1 Tax=Stenotrophomonas sp. JC08 TaxID=3445779 RepID=UPI003FA246E1